ncbi:MAG: ATP synthase F1 subunit delta [Pyrinomonas methylaliphatogenes]|nr:ATP synthase F1 subunit delta [Pyrinomonas methylaliphatogenes]
MSAAVARRYAVALADVVFSRNEAREVQEELLAWQRMIEEHALLLEVFRNPTVRREQKRKVLESLIARTRVRQTTANFLRVLLQNHRLAQLEEINRYFAAELDARKGVISAQVTTARPLDDETRERLRERLKAATGREVRLQFTIDPNLIGGIVTRIGSTVYDGSVRGQLQTIRERLMGEGLS